MKKIISGSIIYIVFSMFGLNVQAEESVNDLNQRLQQEISTYKNQIETYRGQQLVDAADLLTGSGLSDFELYKIVDAKAHLILKEHMAQEKDARIGAELTAIIRTMAAMSTLSAPFIQEVLYSSKSHSVRNRAVRLPKKLNWFVERNKIMQQPDSYVPGQDLMTYRYINLINNDEPAFGRWAAEEIQRRGGAESAVYQAMGKKLLAKKDNIGSDTELDYLAWICKVLAIYDAQNSHQILDAILNDSRHDAKFMKLKNEANYHQKTNSHRKAK